MCIRMFKYLKSKWSENADEDYERKWETQKKKTQQQNAHA